MWTPSLLLLVACDGEPAAPKGDTGEPADTGDSDVPIDTGWTVVPCEGPPSMLFELYRHQSADGRAWDPPVWLMSGVSVPEVVADPAIDGGSAWMLWMAFEQRSDRCDRLVYGELDPATGTLGTIRPVTIRGAPPSKMMDGGYRHPNSDPDVVVVGGRAVMASTVWLEGDEFACATLAPASEAGSLVDGTFDFQSHLLFCDEDAVEGYTDPMAIWLPDDPADPDSPGVIRVWVSSAEAMLHGGIDNSEWIVAVPDPHDAATWYEAGRRTATFNDFHSLGSALVVNEPDCEWGVWGSLNSWVRHACTSDFEVWTELGPAAPYAADPVVIPSADGWTMFVTRDESYTGEPARVALPDHRRDRLDAR